MLPSRPAVLPPHLLCACGDECLLTAAACTVGPAIRRQAWFLVCTSAGRFAPVLLPCDDLPAGAAAADALLVGRLLETVLAETRTDAAVIIWECPGDRRLDPRTRAWARAMAELARRGEVRLRGQVLAHDTGVRLLGAAELGVAEQAG